MLFIFKPDVEFWSPQGRSGKIFAWVTLSVIRIAKNQLQKEKKLSMAKTQKKNLYGSTSPTGIKTSQAPGQTPAERLSWRNTKTQI